MYPGWIGSTPTLPASSWSLSIGVVAAWTNWDSRKKCGELTMKNGYGSIPINTIFRGMTIHLPAILMFTRGTRFWHTAKWWTLQVWAKNHGEGWGFTKHVSPLGISFHRWWACRVHMFFNGWLNHQAVLPSYDLWIFMIDCHLIHPRKKNSACHLWWFIMICGSWSMWFASVSMSMGQLLMCGKILLPDISPVLEIFMEGEIWKPTLPHGRIPIFG